MTGWLAVLWLLLAQTGPACVHGWATSFDQPFNFTCQPGQAIVYSRSQYSGQFQDRKWDFRCGEVDPAMDTSRTKCSWTGKHRCL